MRRLLVDFNTMQADPQERVILGEVGTPNGDRLVGFQPGERVVLDGGDLQVEGILVYDREHQVWYALPEWTTRQDLPVDTSADIAV